MWVEALFRTCFHIVTHTSQPLNPGFVSMAAIRVSCVAL